MAFSVFIYLSYTDAVEKHFELIGLYGEVRFGVDSRDLLKSSLARPRQAAAYEDADIFRQAATLCFGLIKNHPWFGGNKRTATYLTEIFLELNEYRLICELSEIIEIALKVEADEWKVSEIEEWLGENAKKIENA